MDEEKTKSTSRPSLFDRDARDARDALRKEFFSSTSDPFASPPTFTSPFSSVFDRQDLDATGTSTVKNDPSSFQIFLDVSQFRAEEIDVKTVGNEVVIHGKHEDRSDEHGSVSREFTRKYLLPLGVDPEKVVCFYDSKGILAVKASKDIPEKTGKETLISVKKNERVDANGRIEKKSETYSETRTSSSSSSTSTKTATFNPLGRGEALGRTSPAPKAASKVAFADEPSSMSPRPGPTSYYQPSTSRMSTPSPTMAAGTSKTSATAKSRGPPLVTDV